MSQHSSGCRHAYRRARWTPIVMVAALVSACLEPDPNDPDVRDAIREVNAEFGAAYQHTLLELGTRQYALEPPQAMTAMAHVLTQMGFEIRRREGDYYLHVVGPAPTPLDEREWARARASDEPRLRELAVKHLGIKGNLARLQPEGLDIHGFITMVPTAAGVDIAITMRMLETVAPPANSILPRREYPPPQAARIGFDKIWRRFNAYTNADARVTTGS